MNCQKCGRENQDSTKFCGECGTLLNRKAKAKNNKAIGCLSFIIIIVVIFIIIALSNNNKPTSNTASMTSTVVQVDSGVETSIRAEIGKAIKYFSINKIYMLDTGTIEVWVNSKFNPDTQNEISVWTNGFVEDLENKYNYELDIRIDAMQPIEGTDKYRVFGASSFHKADGKIVYEPQS